MPLDQNGVLTNTDGISLREQVYPELIKTNYISTPFLSSHLKMIDKFAGRLVWTQQALTKNQVTLSAQYTSGTGVMSITAGSTTNPTVLFVGNSQLSTTDGALIFNVTGFNSTKTSLTVSVAVGSDTTIASGTTLRVTSYKEHGSDSGAEAYFEGATSDINYFSNKQFNFKVAKLIEDGKFEDIGYNELSVEHQEKFAFKNCLKQIEFDVFKSPRSAGTGAPTRQGNTTSSGTGARAGGYATFINNGGGRVVSTAAVLSESMLASDVAYMRDLGAFQDLEETVDNPEGEAIVKVYCNRATLEYVNSLVKLERYAGTYNPSQRGRVGTYVTDYLVGGIVLKFTPTTGLDTGELIYEPRPDLNSIEVIRMFETTADYKESGDNRKVTKSVTWRGRFMAPWLSVWRTNITSP